MKGRSEIILTDVNTGEVIKYVDENMFTNALANAINRAPWYMANDKLMPTGKSNSINPLAPIVGNALGGVLAFPQPIAEDANTLYAPASNKPTGIASFEAYAGSDTRRGNYNEVESGPITGGHKFVFDFATSQANGLISCIALTSRRGAAGYWDGGENIFQDAGAGRETSIGMLRYLPRGYAVFGADDKGLYIFNYTNNSDLNIYRANTPKRKITLYGGNDNIETLGAISAQGTLLLHDGFVWLIRNNTNNSGNATLNIEKYNVNTWEKQTTTMVVQATLYGSEKRYTCISGDYLYMLGANRTSFFKININNVADVTEIPNVYPAAYSGIDTNCGAFNGGMISRYALIESDNTVHQHDILSTLIATDGTWALMSPRNIHGSYETGIGATIISPYLATINNLGNAFTKTANQTMKIIYSVYES